MKTYDCFVSLVMAGNVTANPFLRFGTVCRYLKADPFGLDALVFSETGWHGQELIDIFRAA